MTGAIYVAGPLDYEVRKRVSLDKFRQIKSSHVTSGVDQWELFECHVTGQSNQDEAQVTWHDKKLRLVRLTFFKNFLKIFGDEMLTGQWGKTS